VEEQWSGYFDHCDSSHWLHFQQLDWERNWLVFRDEQFSFSHDERAYHGDGHFHSQSQPYSNADGNPYSYSNTDGYAHPDANTLNPTPRSTATPKPNPNSSPPHMATTMALAVKRDVSPKGIVDHIAMPLRS